MTQIIKWQDFIGKQNKKPEQEVVFTHFISGGRNNRPKETDVKPSTFDYVMYIGNGIFLAWDESWLSANVYLGYYKDRSKSGRY